MRPTTIAGRMANDVSNLGGPTPLGGPWAFRNSYSRGGAKGQKEPSSVDAVREVTRRPADRGANLGDITASQDRLAVKHKKGG